MASYWPSSTPTGIWLIGEYLYGSQDCELEYPNPDPGTPPPPNIVYEEDPPVDHEAMLTYFDTHGIKVFLQVEPGDADVGTLIDLVLGHFGHHPCVAGFGVDVEWLKDADGKASDAEAAAWESKVKSHNSAYRLFLKHWDAAYIPPTYRGDIIFIDDSQGFKPWKKGLDKMVAEFSEWANYFYPNPVGFQIGYERDRQWWSKLANPPEDIGDALDAAIPNPMGVFWVDFTLREVFPSGAPPPPEDNTPPAAPTGLTATAVSSSQIDLDWNANTESDLDHYSVYRDGTFVASTTVSNYSDTGLSASTTYYYKVTAVDTSGNESDPSAQASATTQSGAAPPPPPTGGWDFECHTHTHANLTNLTENEIRAELEAVNAAFIAHGYAPPKHLAYPYGGYGDEVEAVVAEYRLSGRMVWGFMMTYPITNWYELKAAQLKRSTPFGKIQGWIDDCVADAALLHIFTHDVCADPSQYGCTPEKLAQTLDYALEKQNAGLLEIVTMAEAYDYWSTATQGKAMVVFSFDDANLSDYENVYPMFYERNIAGTSYIITDAVDNPEAWGPEPRLTWAMVDAMVNWEPPSGAPADNTPPVISNVASSDITSSSATITWDTDEASNSVVNYGTTTALGSTALDNTKVTSHTITLTGLSASTTYYYEVQSTDSSGNTAVDDNNGSYYTFTTTAPDTTPPVITNVTASDITSNSATITWDTDEPADSLVKYGTTSGSYTDSKYDSTLVTSHSVTPTGLTASTTYYYVVSSTDPSGNTSESSEHSFTTEAIVANTMHVANIAMFLETLGVNTNALAEVTVHDANGVGVEGATVYGHWEGATTDSDSGTTDANGVVGKFSLQSDSIKNAPSGTTFIFVVDNIVKEGWAYDPSANVETSDSITT
jgi:peptidoglycan/xylan/chitin deacetylase (PgdA/CDA1 family)